MVPHIPLLIGIFFSACLGKYLKYSWHDLEDGMVKVVKTGIPSIMILMLVGITISVWIAAGTVPTIIYFGLKLISPQFFLLSAMIICAISSLCLGTSWGVVGTIGLALIGIGHGFNIPIYWTAGAIVSGAFFGDKISPLSDTTNLAAAVTQNNVFEHIKAMLPTTIPAMIIAGIIYLISNLLLFSDAKVDFEKINLITQNLEQDFKINILCLLPAFLVFYLAFKKVPSIPSLFFGIIGGVIIAIFYQNQELAQIFNMSFAGHKYYSNIDSLNSLLNRGGLQSMSWAILLVIIALAFGGILEKIKSLEVILSTIAHKLKSFANLQTCTILSAGATNIVAGDPYLSIALPGRVFKKAYENKGYSSLNLSRAVEEGGTLISPLIPWNSGGAFVITALGLGIFEGELINLLYIPLSFSCWISPILGILYAYLGWFSPKNNI